MTDKQLLQTIANELSKQRREVASATSITPNPDDADSVRFQQIGFLDYLLHKLEEYNIQPQEIEAASYSECAPDAWGMDEKRY